MKRGLIIGDSGGIGAALFSALEARGVTVTGLSRSRDGLDITSEESVEQRLGALDGDYDLILVTTGALEIGAHEPEKSLRKLTAEAMLAQFKVNTVGPAMVLKHAVKLLPKDRRAVIAVLSARVGSIGDNNLGGWYSYRTAKAAVNQIIHTTAIELARSHKNTICVALHPGTVQTEFTRKYVGRHPSVPAPEAADNLLSVIDGLTTAQTGGFYDWAGKVIPW
ncbi:C factor, cell signaling protein [Kineobactrum sediminis]|uniref:C factor, cell signaling protein n=2 Tax=Kineobactrum sediminis TaxID=1905677 RepID=A0A2N5XZ05_9GAMM|nr:C factor, cell signaling protein [Kineobactrum sediminis]